MGDAENEIGPQASSRGERKRKMEQYNVNLKQLGYGVGLIINGALEVLKALTDEAGNLALAPDGGHKIVPTAEGAPVPVAEELEEAPPKEPEAVPKETEINLIDVRTALARLSKKGLTKEVKELLFKHGGTKLSDIDPANYAALLAEAKELDPDA